MLNMSRCQRKIVLNQHFITICFVCVVKHKLLGFRFSCLFVDRQKKKKEKMMFMEVFKGSYKAELIDIDSERLCKHKLPKSRSRRL